MQRLEHWIRRTLYDFARESLKATVLGAVAMGKLEMVLTKPLGAERTRAALGELTMGVRPDPEADLPGAIRDLGEGKIDRAAFLERFGHRGPQEMELAQPRWSEDPSALDERMYVAKPTRRHPVGLPENAWERIAAEAKLSSLQRQILEPELKSLHAYLSLRETGKHTLMKGYALIRRILVELDRRHHLNGGIFFLTPDELPRLAKGEDLSKSIEERRRRRRGGAEPGSAAGAVQRRPGSDRPAGDGGGRRRHAGGAAVGGRGRGAGAGAGASRRGGDAGGAVHPGVSLDRSRPGCRCSSTRRDW